MMIMVNEKKPRLPPGQRKINRFPVLQHGSVAHLDRESYVLKIDGLVEKPLELSLQDLMTMQKQEEVVDIHCVTSWSKFDMKWGGILFRKIIEMVKPKPNAKFVVAHCADDGFTTSLPLDVLADDDVLLAYEYDGKPLDDKHGGPVRTLVPKRYFYKSAKWVKRLEFVEEDQLGLWERGGYSNTADPWKEERYAL